jgi:hypothetical protein
MMGDQKRNQDQEKDAPQPAKEDQGGSTTQPQSPSEKSDDSKDGGTEAA